MTCRFSDLNDEELHIIENALGEHALSEAHNIYVTDQERRDRYNKVKMLEKEVRKIIETRQGEKP